MKPVFLATLSVLLTATVVSAQVPNLAGTWTLDVEKSTAVGGGRGQREATGGGRGGGLGLGPAADRLSIAQDASAITITERRGSADSTVLLRLDGQPQARTFAAGRSAGRTSSSATSIKDGRVHTTVTLPAALAGGSAVTYQEIRFIDGDGSLVLEITTAGSANSRRSVYSRVK